MADIVPKATRSRMMSGIRGKNTRPEMAVRRYLHSLGLRYRLHDGKLPGRPDLVFPKYRTVVQVYGCFWHQHNGCQFAYMPKSNGQFWREKLGGNVERDLRNNRALRTSGWRVLAIWECETTSTASLKALAGKIRRNHD